MVFREKITFAQIWAKWAQNGPVWTENLNLAEYGHVIYRWIANVMLITDFEIYW